MALQEQETRLLGTMRKTDFYRSKVFNKDGIVDHETWKQQEIKILFILKETNDLQETNAYQGDLRAFLRGGATGVLWNNVARWSYGIQNSNEGQIDSWGELAEITQEKRAQILRSIAVVNMKKSPGKASSDWKKIEEAVDKNKEQLKEQVALISPNVIICGGTKYYFQRLFDIAPMDIHITDNGVQYCVIDTTPVVFYYHPSARKPKKEMFDDLMYAYKQIKSDNTPC